MKDDTEKQAGALGLRDCANVWQEKNLSSSSMLVFPTILIN